MTDWHRASTLGGGMQSSPVARCGRIPGNLGGFSVSGIHLCPQMSHTATRVVETLPQKVFPCTVKNEDFG
jgi:hypothetical protein